MKQNREDNLRPENGTRFSSEYQPKNRGKAKGFDKALKEVMQSDGFFRLDFDQIESIAGVKPEDIKKLCENFDQFRPDMGIVVKVNTSQAAALRISEMIGSKKNYVSLKAIKFAAERTDGKPTQSHNIKHEGDVPSAMTLDIRDFDEEEMKLLSRIAKKRQQQKESDS